MSRFYSLCMKQRGTGQVCVCARTCEESESMWMNLQKPGRFAIKAEAQEEQISQYPAGFPTSLVARRAKTMELTLGLVNRTCDHRLLVTVKAWQNVLTSQICVCV